MTAGPGTSSGRRRIVAALLSGAVVIAGLSVHLALPGSVGADIAGDALYAALLYLLVVVLQPRLRPAPVALIAGAACITIELFQLTGLPRVWASGFPPIALVLGTGFDVRDIVVYLAAAALAAAVDTVAGGRRGTRAAGSSSRHREATR